MSRGVWQGYVGAFCVSKSSLSATRDQMLAHVGVVSCAARESGERQREAQTQSASKRSQPLYQFVVRCGCWTGWLGLAAWREPSAGSEACCAGESWTSGPKSANESGAPGAGERRGEELVVVVSVTATAANSTCTDGRTAATQQ